MEIREKHGPYHELLHAAPAPPSELHALLRYLSDGFTLLDDWILQPDQDAAKIETITARAHLESTKEGDDVQLRHPGKSDLGPGWTETYERTEEGAARLRHDVWMQAMRHTESRSQWTTWTNEARTPEEIRIALRGAPGYYVECPLDCDDKPFHVLATLERTPEDEDPDGPRTTEVAINPDTEHVLQTLASCARPLPLRSP